jgi:hypothetical protein
MINATTLYFRRPRRKALVAAWRRGRNGKLLITWTAMRRFQPPKIAA